MRVISCGEKSLFFFFFFLIHHFDLKHLEELCKELLVEQKTKVGLEALLKRKSVSA